LYHSDPYWDAESTPLFAFGSGLTFTTFEYVSVTTEKKNTAAHSITFDVTLRNNGTVAGTEVVMLFVTAPLDNVVRYWKRLVGFKKVQIEPSSQLDGGTVVTINVALDDLKVYTTSVPGSPAAGARTLLRGNYTLSVGGSSTTDWGLKTSFTL
jgi:hypothetical protein